MPHEVWSKVMFLHLFVILFTRGSTHPPVCRPSKILWDTVNNFVAGGKIKANTNFYRKLPPHVLLPSCCKHLVRQTLQTNKLIKLLDFWLNVWLTPSHFLIWDYGSAISQDNYLNICRLHLVFEEDKVFLFTSGASSP